MGDNVFDAIQTGDADAIRRMVDADPTLVNAGKEDGTSVVLWCVYTRHPELISLFPRQLDLFEACAAGQEDRALELLNKNPELLQQYSGDGHTPLGLAVFFRHADLARELIRRGADVNKPSRNVMGVAPIHAAAAAGDAELVRLLIEKGADVNAKQASGHTALDSAKQSGREDIAALLLRSE